MIALRLLGQKLNRLRLLRQADKLQALIFRLTVQIKMLCLQWSLAAVMLLFLLTLPSS